MGLGRIWSHAALWLQASERTHTGVQEDEDAFDGVSPTFVVTYRMGWEMEQACPEADPPQTPHGPEGLSATRLDGAI
jgi:hypothetical protein